MASIDLLRPRVVAQPQMARRNRNPSHPFHLRTIPFTIQPFLIAPVLPGETMKNMLMQSRCVTDPIINPLIGWHNEYYFFYVKLRDLDDREEYSQMMVDPTWTPAAVKSETSVPANFFKGEVGQNWIDFVQACLERVTKTYFRGEEEAWNDHLIDSKPAASINTKSWLDSVVNNTALAAAPDVTISTAGDNAFDMSELERAMLQWQHLRDNGLVQQTFEEYVATFGVRLPDKEEPHRPELLRYSRNWSYPSNTIDPATGEPSSAVSWSIAERADKDRRFTEPGFIFGVTVKRPKVYISGHRGSVTSVMNDAYSWLPATMRNTGAFAMKEITAAKGPLNAITDSYWIDLRDLLQYGEQYVNFALTATDFGQVALPTAALQKRYPVDLDAVKALFVTGATAYFVREDGVVNLTIASHVGQDVTPMV